MLVQRTWRGYVDRAFVKCLRREAYQKSIAAAKHRARLELKARIVQGAWRRRQAKKVRLRLQRESERVEDSLLEPFCLFALVYFASTYA
jgi:hypothetical protein